MIRKTAGIFEWRHTLARRPFETFYKTKLLPLWELLLGVHNSVTFCHLYEKLPFSEYIYNFERMYDNSHELCSLWVWVSECMCLWASVSVYVRLYVCSCVCVHMLLCMHSIHTCYICSLLPTMSKWAAPAAAASHKGAQPLFTVGTYPVFVHVISRLPFSGP